MRILRIFAFLIPLGFAVAWCSRSPQSYSAQANIGNDVSVALIITPMFSLQSDWYRKLLIKTPTGTLEHDIGEDTGWWRGSNLYRHSSGIYVLYEGQDDYTIFSISPLKIMQHSIISCDKDDQIMRNNRKPAPNPQAGFLGTRYCTGFEYIGHFGETLQEHEQIRFRDANERTVDKIDDIL